MRSLRSFETYAMEQLCNPQFATAYLTEALHDFNNDHDAEALLMALRDVTEAQGGIGELAKRTHLSRQNLYKVFAAKRQPKIETLGAILGGLGLSMAVVPSKEIATLRSQ